MRPKPIQFLLLIPVCWVLLSGNRPLPQQQVPVSHTFGLSLNTGMNNELFTLFILKMHGLHVIDRRPLTRQQFVLQAQGAIPSEANPDQVNFFRKFKVEPCVHPDSTKYYMDCPVLDDLWKLRFWEYPFHPMDGQHPGRGWAGKKAAPNAQQMVKLADYGFMRLSDIIHGENVFRLLHDVSDSTWVVNYRSGS